MRQGGEMFKLRDIEPIAQGNKRFVYQHPTDPNLLIKVWKPTSLKNAGANGPGTS
jgi:hypothetical protein